PRTVRTETSNGTPTCRRGVDQTHFSPISAEIGLLNAFFDTVGDESAYKKRNDSSDIPGSDARSTKAMLQRRGRTVEGRDSARAATAREYGRGPAVRRAPSAAKPQQREPWPSPGAARALRKSPELPKPDITARTQPEARRYVTLPR